eukprot:750567-Hanusia_phi.AAC.1
MFKLASKHDGSAQTVKSGDRSGLVSKKQQTGRQTISSGGASAGEKAKKGEEYVEVREAKEEVERRTDEQKAFLSPG